eukprot:scaffold225574_cov17-Tisochrysis_lutea.AAC.1
MISVRTSPHNRSYLLSEFELGGWPCSVHIHWHVRRLGWVCYAENIPLVHCKECPLYVSSPHNRTYMSAV